MATPQNSTSNTVAVESTVFGSDDADKFDSAAVSEGFVGTQQLLFTGGGNDTVDTTFAFGDNRVDLGSGDDLFFGGSGDRVLAGPGNDILFLSGGEGNNVVTGETGADQFWLITDEGDIPESANTITDFTPTEDVLGFGASSLTFDDLTLSQDGQNTVVKALGIEVAILRNTQVNDLTESNFVFDSFESQQDIIRFATFNASLNRSTEGELITDLSTKDDPQVQAVAEIIQRINPDVLNINEFDYDDQGKARELFQDNYLSVSQKGADPVEYPYFYQAPSNTGIASGFDLDNNGQIVTTPGQSGYGGDAFGFGDFPGQYGQLFLSKYPIIQDQVRTFQTFLWKDMPGALLPDDPSTPEPNDWYSTEELDVFRLASKNFLDIPVLINGEVVHMLSGHPTPPVFDGSEDRNGARNHDEIRFWSDYVTPGDGGYIYDDEGHFGGLSEGAKFVLVGDQNADPFDGDSVDQAIRQVLDNPLFNTSFTPSSQGGVQASERQGGVNETHVGDSKFDTGDFGDAEGGSGNLRTDYVLPSKNLEIVDGSVFWPTEEDPLYRLTGNDGSISSDHRAVWVDAKVGSQSSGLDSIGTTFSTGFQFGNTEVGW